MPKSESDDVTALFQAAQRGDSDAANRLVLTGRPPFRGATLEQIQHQEPVSPRRQEPTIPRDLDTVCLKCLEKNPAKRYATPLELADEWKRFLADEPVRPPSELD